MSANLIEDASAVHTFQDDLESSFWLLLWAAFMFMPSSLSLVDHTKFIQQTFEGAGQQKRSILISQTILNCDKTHTPNDVIPLFPDQPPLYWLLEDLADLFCNRYWKPDPADWRMLMTISKLVQAEGGIMEDVITSLPAYCYQQFQEKLRDHNYMINCFVRHLEEQHWPKDNKSAEQELIEVEQWDMEGTNKVTLLQSKHILGCVEMEEMELEQEQQRPKKVKCTK